MLKRENEFVIRCDKQAVPVEVKSADNTKAKSMDALLKSGQVKHGVNPHTTKVACFQHTVQPCIPALGGRIAFPL